jgi:hypothetical protein
MNANEILNAVLTNKKSLVRLTKDFGSNNVIGYFVKDEAGQLLKVHGKSAKTASRVLHSADGVVRSYGKAKVTTGSKSMTVFMTEFFKFDGLL